MNDALQFHSKHTKREKRSLESQDVNGDRTSKRRLAISSENALHEPGKAGVIRDLERRSLHGTRSESPSTILPNNDTNAEHK